MKLELDKKKKRHVQIIVTDKNGNIEQFDNIKKLAELFECTRQAIYQAISNHTKLRGCKIESK